MLILYLLINRLAKKQYLLFLTALTMLAPTLAPFPAVYAIDNNNENVPDFILNNLKNAGHHTIRNSKSFGPGSFCDPPKNLYKHAQFSWLSQASNNSTNEITIKEGTNSVNLWLNVLAATCDIGVGPAPEGKILPGVQGLKETQTNIVSSSASVGSTNLTVTGLAGGTKLNLDYNLAYFYNQRFVKPKNTNDNFMSKQPLYKQFKVTGLGNLIARDQPYIIRVQSTDRMVNRFNNGGGNVFRCVAGDTHANSLSDTNCKTSTRALTIRLKVAKSIDAGCTIMNNTIESGVVDRVKVGETFDVTMIVGNNGVSSWGADVSLGSGYKTGSTVQPEQRNNNFWKAKSNGNASTVNAAGNRIALHPYSVPGSGGSSEPSKVLPALRFAKFKVIAPDAPGVYPFAWQVVRENVGWIGSPCLKTIEVYEDQNKPFVSILGGDVIAGARFGSRSLGGMCQPSTASAVSANIYTNGHYGDSALSEALYGSSSSQFGVMASGNIGDSDYSKVNTFVGNFGYQGRDGLPSGGRKDLTFANNNLQNNQHGNFFANEVNAPLPCVDVTPIENQAGTASVATTASITNFINQPGKAVGAFTGNVALASNLLVPASSNKTIIVNGDVTIPGNINYSPGPYSSTSEMPQLTIVARNIYIKAASGPTVLDANLYAIPTKSTDGKQENGIIDTCSNASNLPLGQWYEQITIGSCRRTPNGFTVNGQVIARRMLLKRTGGTVGPDHRVKNAECNYAVGSGGVVDMESAVSRIKECSAELINTRPDLYISNFSEDAFVDSVPRSTVELPPIF